MIRIDLTKQGFSEHEIKAIIRKVDEKVLRFEVNQSLLDKAKTWHRTGIVIAVLGLLLTSAANAGWIAQDSPKWLLYSPFFLGF